MHEISFDETILKKAVKAAMVELLEERGDLLGDLFEEALLDVGLLYAIEAGERTSPVSRDEVFSILEPPA